MTAPELLPPHLLERLGGLDLIALRIVEAMQAGRHRAPLRGAGEEFTRHREYRAGDDLRALDWRLYGRTDRLYVREYRSDSNLRAFILIDTTLSMGHGDGHGLTKLRYASYLAAALTHLMLRVGDRVGLASYGARSGAAVDLHLPPSNRAGHLQEVLRILEGLEPEGDAGLAAALDVVAEALGRRGRIVVISDLLERDEGAALLDAVGRVRARGDEVILVRPLTPEEVGDGVLGAGRYFDPERPARVIDAAPAEDPGYAARVAAYYSRLELALRELGAEYVPCTTETPVELLLGEWLSSRGALR